MAKGFEDNMNVEEKAFAVLNIENFDKTKALEKNIKNKDNEIKAKGDKERRT